MASTRAAPNPGAVNSAYVPQLEVELSGVKFPVFGSMSWTVAQVKKRDWETEVRPAYVGLTGDGRPEVDRDLATQVVCGELQFTWAEISKRDDLMPALRDNQEKRVDAAVTSVEQPKKGKGSGGSRATRSASNTAQTRRGNMSENENEGGAATATALPEKVGPTGMKLPVRGFMGEVRRAIEKRQEAGQEVITEEEVLDEAEAASPGVQNGSRHMRYVARIMGVSLVKPAKAAGEEPAADPEAEPAGDSDDAEGDDPAEEE